MTVRNGMYDLIYRWRAGVADTDSSVFDDDHAQDILDTHRYDFYQLPLAVTAQQVAVGSVTYRVYSAPYANLEGTASGTAYVRLYDANGTALSSYTLDAINGKFNFTANQAGSARYLDGRSFDLNGAIADGWRERAGMQTGNYDFQVEGRRYTRSQWFTHCITMADTYDARSTGNGTPSDRSGTGSIERGDMVC